MSEVSARFGEDLGRRLDGLHTEGLFKTERLIASPQGAKVTLDDGRELLNFCANNYLGLADHPIVVEAAHRGLDRYGYGMASVRFICGTQTPHRALEERISRFLCTEDTILYASCFDANGGLFEALLDENDAVISDALNHASIIDGVRLSKARRYRYANNDMDALEQRLVEASGSRYRLIATDGVFSMDGVIANLPMICDLADRYGAMVMVDDSHAVGLLGGNGGGTPELTGTVGRIDILTGTLGKALGGAAGGYTSGRAEVVAWLRQRSRPYLFSNALPPMVCEASVAAIDLIESSATLRERLQVNAARFRDGMERAGFELNGAGHPIIPVMLGEATIAIEMATRLVERGVYVIGFCYPVVPMGQARIRVQMSAAHSIEQVDFAVAAFEEVGRSMGLIR